MNTHVRSSMYITVIHIVFNLEHFCLLLQPHGEIEDLDSLSKSELITK